MPSSSPDNIDHPSSIIHHLIHIKSHQITHLSSSQHVQVPLLSLDQFLQFHEFIGIQHQGHLEGAEVVQHSLVGVVLVQVLRLSGIDGLGTVVQEVMT